MSKIGAVGNEQLAAPLFRHKETMNDETNTPKRTTGNGTLPRGDGRYSQV
jgi:hypothetical protein